MKPGTVVKVKAITINEAPDAPPWASEKARKLDELVFDRTRCFLGKTGVVLKDSFVLKIVKMLPKEMVSGDEYAVLVGFPFKCTRHGDSTALYNPSELEVLKEPGL